MKKKNSFMLVLPLIILLGCQAFVDPIKESSEGFEINEGVSLKVVLKTPLNSNINQRGDQFVTQIKEPLLFKNKTILSEGTEIHGLIKRATKYEKFSDRAGLVLLFDQIILKDGRRIPISASLDTDKGSAVIKIKGNQVQNAKIVVGSAVVGTLVGKAALKEKYGGQKGLIIGTAAGAGAVFLSNIKEINLPQEAELIIKTDGKIIIPRI